MKLPTQAEEQQWKAEVNEIRDSIIQKRDSRVKITSINTQRFIVDEVGSISWYLAFTGLLLLVKLIQPNQISSLFIVVGICITLSALFIFGVSIIKLKQKQENGSIKEKLIYPLLLLSFVPYIFGLYLILDVGAYNLLTQLREVPTTSSFIYLLQAIIYAYLGYLIIKKAKRIQELGLRISGNK
jgi:hypothetical protein